MASQVNNHGSKRNYYFLVSVVFIGFLIFGFSENIKGPAIPRMQAEFSLNEMNIGLMLSLNSLGYLMACSFTGYLIKRSGLKVTNILAFGSMALSGVFIFLSANFPMLSGAYFFLYIGNGMLEIALAVLGARIFTKNMGTMMNLSHFFYGLSSMVAPIFATKLMGVAVTGTPLGWRGMYLIMLALSFIPVIPTLLSKFPGDSVEDKDRMPWKEYISDPAAWLIVAIISFGVISELSVGGWLVNFLEKSYGWSVTSASAMLSAFFMLFMLARLLLGPVIDKLGFVKSLIISSGFSGICTFAAIFSGQRGAFMFAAAGIGIAPVYPTVMAFLAKRYPKDSDTAIGFTVTLMGIACVIGNFLVGGITDLFKGIFSNIYGSETGLKIGLQWGYGFIGLCAIICSVTSIWLYTFLKRKNELV